MSSFRKIISGILAFTVMSMNYATGFATAVQETSDASETTETSAVITEVSETSSDTPDVVIEETEEVETEVVISEESVEITDEQDPVESSEEDTTDDTAPPTESSETSDEEAEVSETTTTSSTETSVDEVDETEATETEISETTAESSETSESSVESEPDETNETDETSESTDETDETEETEETEEIKEIEISCVEVADSEDEFNSFVEGISEDDWILTVVTDDDLVDLIADGGMWFDGTYVFYFADEDSYNTALSYVADNGYSYTVTEPAVNYIVFDHYFSSIDESLVSTSEIFIITEDPSVFTKNTNAVSNYDNAYIIECSSVEEARFVYSYYVDKVEFITDLSAVATVADNDDVEDVADLSDLNNGEDAIANLSDIDTSDDYSGYIALIDTGANADVNYSVISDDTGDNNGHGSKMLTCIRDVNNNAKVISIKVSEDGSASAADIYAGFRLAMDLGVSVINFSMTALNIEKNSVIKEVIEEAIASGVTVIGAAGNNSTSASHFIPGCIDDVITVGAANAGGTRYSTSNYDADYYVVAESSSEATAKFTGYYTSNTVGMGLICFDVYEELEEEEYGWAYRIADSLSEAAQVEGLHVVYEVIINDDGSITYEQVSYEDEFTIAENASEVNWATGTYSGSIPAGKYSGTCTLTKATSSGTNYRGVATGFTGNNAFSNVANTLGGVNAVCSKSFPDSYRSSYNNYARNITFGTVYYGAEVDSSGNVYIYFSDRADSNGWPVDCEATGIVSEYVGTVHQNLAGSKLVGYYLTVVRTRYNNGVFMDKTTVNTFSTTLTSASAAVSDLEKQANAVYSGKVNIVDNIGKWTVQELTSQMFMAKLTSNGTTGGGDDGGASFQKIDGETNKGLAGATVTLTSSTAGAMSNVECSTGATVSANGVLTFTTTTGTITFKKLAANTTYTFTETKAPAGYAIADPISFTTDSSGNAPASTYTMKDYTSSGGVKFNKVESSDTSEEVGGATIIFQTAAASSVDAATAFAGISFTAGTGVTATRSGNTITFNTIKGNGNDITITGLAPNATYQFSETVVPSGYGKASDIFVYTDETGVGN